jgi:hypothetical protein
MLDLIGKIIRYGKDPSTILSEIITDENPFLKENETIESQLNNLNLDENEETEVDLGGLVNLNLNDRYKINLENSIFIFCLKMKKNPAQCPFY